MYIDSARSFLPCSKDTLLCEVGEHVPSFHTESNQGFRPPMRLINVRASMKAPREYGDKSFSRCGGWINLMEEGLR